MDVDCFSCRTALAPDAPPRDRVFSTSRWRVVTALGASLPGWLVVLPARHVEALSGLTAEEAAELGPLLTDVSRALEESTGCVKTYAVLFAEAEGFAHLHFHVVPRAADLPEGLRGARVFGALTGGEPVPTDRQDRLAERVGGLLAAMRAA